MNTLNQLQLMRSERHSEDALLVEIVRCAVKKSVLSELLISGIESTFVIGIKRSLTKSIKVAVFIKISIKSAVCVQDDTC